MSIFIIKPHAFVVVCCIDADIFWILCLCMNLKLTFSMTLTATLQNHSDNVNETSSIQYRLPQFDWNLCLFILYFLIWNAELGISSKWFSYIMYIITPKFSGNVARMLTIKNWIKCQVTFLVRFARLERDD